MKIEESLSVKLQTCWKYSSGSVLSILKDNLNIRRIAAKFVPRLLREGNSYHVPGRIFKGGFEETQNSPRDNHG
jgi:hypothetical protein